MCRVRRSSDYRRKGADAGQPSSEDIQKAKAQAQRLVSVNGTACALHIGSLAFFRQDELEFYWRDPAPEQPEKLEPMAIEVTNEDWANYYAFALALAAESKSDVLSARVQEIDLKVEIHPKVLVLLRKSQWAAARSLADELRETLESEGFQPDGVRVRAGESWQKHREGAHGG